MKGLPYPKAPEGGQWSRRVIEELKTDKVYEEIKFELEQLIDVLSFTYKKILEVQRETRKFCKSEAQIKESIEYISGVPGIGNIIAAELLARIGDWRNLRNSRAQVI